MAGLIGLSACDGPAKFVQVGESTESESLKVIGGIFFLVSGSPGVLCGTVERPSEVPYFSYLILIKHDLTSQFSGACDSSTKDTGSMVRDHHIFDVDGRSLEVDFGVERETGVESLKINGASVDPAKGRVFLLDWTGRQPLAQLDLPVYPPRITTTAEMEAWATDTLRKLRVGRPEVEAFFR